MVCMQYVNGTVELCYNLQKLDSGAVGAYLNPFDEIAVDLDENGYLSTPPFWAVVRTNVIGSASDTGDPKTSVSPIGRGVTLGFRLNLTKCCPAVDGKNNSLVLGMFALDMEKVKKNQACFSYVNHTQLVEIPPLKLPGDHGGYVVKLVVREMKPGEDLEKMRNSRDFSVQAMTSLYFKRRGYTVPGGRPQTV